jgi:hypothetical protein
LRPRGERSFNLIARLRLRSGGKCATVPRRRRWRRSIQPRPPSLLLPPRRVQLRLSSRVSEALMRCPTQKSALL